MFPIYPSAAGSLAGRNLRELSDRDKIVLALANQLDPRTGEMLSGGGFGTLPAPSGLNDGPEAFAVLGQPADWAALRPSMPSQIPGFGQIPGVLTPSANGGFPQAGPGRFASDPAAEGMNPFNDYPSEDGTDSGFGAAAAMPGGGSGLAGPLNQFRAGVTEADRREQDSACRKQGSLIAIYPDIHSATPLLLRSELDLKSYKKIDPADGKPDFRVAIVPVRVTGDAVALIRCKCNNRTWTVRIEVKDMKKTFRIEAGISGLRAMGGMLDFGVAVKKARAKWDKWARNMITEKVAPYVSCRRYSRDTTLRIRL